MPWQDAAPPAAAARLPHNGQQQWQAGGGALPSEEQLLGVYTALLRQGFQTVQVEDALSTLPLPAVTLESALDWLLLHLDASDLPRHYATQGGRAGAGGSVDVRHKARELPPEQAAAVAQAAAAQAAEDAARAEAELEERRAADAARQAAEAAAAEAKAAAEEQQRRAWIMQYAQWSDDGSVSEAGSSEVEGEVRAVALLWPGGCGACPGG